MPLRQDVNRARVARWPDDLNSRLAFMSAKRQMNILRWIEYRITDLIAESRQQSGCPAGMLYSQTKVMKLKERMVHSI